MANFDNPNGAFPVGTLNGSPWQGSVRAYQLDGSHAAIAVGDLVQMTSDGFLDVYAAGEVGFIGVCVGVLPAVATTVNGKFGDNQLSNTEPTISGAAVRNSAANATDVILVCTAPDAIYEMQEDGDTTPLTLAAVGSNVEIINAGVNSTTGNSTMEIDSTTTAQTATLPFLLLGLAQRPGNELASIDATKPWTRWLVTPANHAFNLAQVGL